jgi:hypothetical protein
MSGIGEFFSGFVSGFFGEPARRRSPGRSAEHVGYDFHRHMRELAEATGLRVGSFRPDSVMFVAPVTGNSCHVGLVFQGGHVLMYAFSNYTFPLGQVPDEIQEIMQARNARMPRCDYDVLDDDEASHCCVTTRVAARDLTPAVFEGALGEIVPPILGMDDFLVEHGYVG